VTIYIGADHRGFALKEKVKKLLIKLDYRFEDMGAFKFDQYDDYTTYAEKVASMVGDETGSRGILICGSGVGVDVAANKFDGVRSSIGKNKDQVKAGRNDDDMNILVLAADFTTDKEAEDMVKAFIKTDFSKKERYIRRIEDIEKIEANN